MEWDRLLLQRKLQGTGSGFGRVLADREQPGNGFQKEKTGI